MVRSNQVMPSADNASLIVTVAVIPDTNGTPGGDEKVRRSKLVSISCFQDIYSRSSNHERTVGLPVNPSELSALECR
jgi:hypothetical protein